MVKVNSRTIQRLLQGHGSSSREADEARRYYSNVNRIKQDNSVLQRQQRPSRRLAIRCTSWTTAISHSWHNLLVTQKVSYAELSAGVRCGEQDRQRAIAADSRRSVYRNSHVAGH